MPDLIPIRELPDLCYYNDPETVLHGDGQWEEVSGGGGVTDHSLLSGRSLSDQHPIGAVTGLQDALDAKVGDSDQRLSDARTPTAHKASHATGGTDPLTPADIEAAPAVRTVGTGLATSGTVNLDMAVLHGTIQTIALSGDVTFTTSNRAAGREVTLILSAGGASRTLAWPSWLVVGTALPTTLASGKTTVVTATCTDTTDAATIAAGAVQS